MLEKLSESQRQELYKYVSMDDFKNYAAIMKDGNIAVSILRVFGKSHQRLDQSNKNKLINYLEDHLYDDEQNDIELCFHTAFLGKISDRYPLFNKLSAYIKDYKYNEYSEEVKNQLQEYKQVYEDSKIRLDFEILLRYLSLPANEEMIYEKMIDKLKNEIELKNKEKEQLHNELKELELKYKESEKKYKELSKTYEQGNKQYEKVLNEYDSYKQRFQVESLVCKFSDFIDVDKSYPSYEEIYNELLIQESNAINQANYIQLKQILSAKYALVLLMEE